MILLIDNYDSFTYNLAHLIGGLGHEIVVHRNDSLTPAEAIHQGADAIVISPGPCTPNEAGICLDLVAAATEARVPVFGVCLGMQSIAQSFGGRITRAARLMHGKTSPMTHNGAGLFNTIPSPFVATRYHSLIAAKDSLPAALEVIATSADDGEIMAIAHRDLPIAGVQFHPESIASEHGSRIVENFLTWAATRRQSAMPATAS